MKIQSLLKKFLLKRICAFCISLENAKKKGKNKIVLKVVNGISLLTQRLEQIIRKIHREVVERQKLNLLDPGDPNSIQTDSSEKSHLTFLICLFSGKQSGKEFLIPIRQFRKKELTVNYLYSMNLYDNIVSILRYDENVIIIYSKNPNLPLCRILRYLSMMIK